MPVIAVADPSVVPDACRTSPADPVALLDAVAAVPPSADVLLLTGGPRATDVARATRLALGESRIGVVEHDVPATAFYVAAAAVGALPDNALGLVPAVLAAVEDACTTRVVVSSVGRLSAPNPSLWQHVQGIWPTTRFVVDERAGTVRLSTEPPVVDGPTVVLATSTPPAYEPDPAWADRRVDVADDGARWGSRRWTATTVLHADLAELVSAVLRPAALAGYPRCRSCGRVGLLGSCVFCRLPLPAEGGSPTGSTTPVDALTTHGGPA